jgi:hypothetical protein
MDPDKEETKPITIQTNQDEENSVSTAEKEP